jgi:hypothetical protein
MAMAGTVIFRVAVPAITGALALLGAPVLSDPADPVEAAFVALGPDGNPTARVITRAGQCPTIALDGKDVRMQSRAAPSTEPLRPTASTPALSKPSTFPVRVCDLAVPKGATSVALNGRQLPLPPRHIDRIVVIGDTGCRLKAKDDAWQACNDPEQYPFARIAARAAAWKPDLVVHVGDYLYRENPCPDGQAGCAGSPWGYGWDAWDADFFKPASPLLAAAPWTFVRGNHENCVRAGQGWWRLLDPRPLIAGRDCNDPVNDVTGDYSLPYAVPLGDGAQIIVMDLSHAGTDKIGPADPRNAQIRQTARMIGKMSAGKTFTFAADHYPFFGVTAEAGRDGKVELHAGNEALDPLFGAENAHIMPKGIDVLLAGHIHVWEQADFAGRQPSQFVAGFSGTQEDTVPLPHTLPASVIPAPATPVHRFDAIVASFGFMTLERTGRKSWRATVFDTDGHQLRECRIKGRHSRCRPG